VLTAMTSASKKAPRGRPTGTRRRLLTRWRTGLVQVGCSLHTRPNHPVMATSRASTPIRSTGIPKAAPETVSASAAAVTKGQALPRRAGSEGAGLCRGGVSGSGTGATSGTALPTVARAATKAAMDMEIRITTPVRSPPAAW
jgi:hypothetical protein